ncbi:MAG: aspartyl/asparaginyl beta-hydroxylase domain-containing protein [Lysobacteraceae bacterium]
MQLDSPFIQLPVRFDADVLAAEIDALGETPWRPHPNGLPGNSALPLVSAEGEPTREATWGPMRSTPYLEKCPYLYQVMACLGAVVGRTRLMRLSGHAEVSAHVDVAYYWRQRMRVHVPIRTQPTVRFYCGSDEVNMAAGECWIFDTWRRHRVVNDAVQSRTHLVLDTVGGAGFFNLLAQSRRFDEPTTGWSTRHVAPDASATKTMAFESVNVPVVMTPWEMREHLGFILGCALPHPQLAQANALCAQLIHQWQALWAEYGESVEGVPAYRAAMTAFEQRLSACATQIPLRNDSGLFHCIKALVCQVALDERMRSTQLHAV